MNKYNSDDCLDRRGIECRSSSNALACIVGIIKKTREYAGLLFEPFTEKSSSSRIDGNSGMEVAVAQRRDALISGKNSPEVAGVLKAAGPGNLINVKSRIAEQGESFADLAAVDGLCDSESAGFVVDAPKVVSVESEGSGHITRSDIAVEVFGNIVICAS